MKHSILHPGTQLLREATEPLPCFLPSKPRHRHTRRPCPSPLAGPEPFPTVPPSPPAPCEPPPTPHRPRQRQRGTDSSAPPETGLPVLSAPQTSGSSLLLFLPQRPRAGAGSRGSPARPGAAGEARPVPRGLRGRCTHRRSGRCRWRMAQKARPSRKEALRSRISTPWYPSHCRRHQACRAPRGPDMGAAAPAAPAAAAPAAAATSPGAGPPGVGPRGCEGRGLQGAGSPRARSPGPAGTGRGPVLFSGDRRAAPRRLPAPLQGEGAAAPPRAGRVRPRAAGGAGGKHVREGDAAVPYKGNLDAPGSRARPRGLCACR